MWTEVASPIGPIRLTSAQDTLTGLMRQHLSGGGIIVAAAHGPIGLDHAKELRLGDSG